MNALFKDAVVVITGGASGIGKALAVQFARSGSVVVVIDRHAALLQDTVTEMHELGYAVHCATVDMTRSSEVKEAFRKIIATHHRIDYVINNAGVFTGGEMRDTPLDDWHAVMQANVTSTINGTYNAYQAMLRQQSGYIVNVSSVAGLIPIPVMGVYGGSKYAITALTYALRNEAKKFNIKVSVVCPTVVNTPLYDTAHYYRVDTKSALRRRDAFQSAEEAARLIMRGIALNRRTIYTSRLTRLMHWMHRLAPSAYDMWARRMLKMYRLKLRTEKQK